MKHFIIMADIVDSSGKAADVLMPAFKELVTSCNKHFKSEIASPLTITLGDEFQGVVKSLAACIKIIFYLDEKILGLPLYFKLRYVVNYGDIGTALNQKSAHGMLGTGLTTARKALEEMKSSKNELLFAGVREAKKLNLASQLYRAFYNDWPEKDLKIAQAFLKNGDYKQLAGTFDKDASSMWRKQRSLKIDDFKASKELITLLANA